MSVALKGATGQATALPPCSPCGRRSFVRWERASRHQHWGKRRTSWPHPTCCKLSSGAQERLTSQIAPPDVAGEGTTSVHNPQSTASLFCPPDVRKRCMIGTAAIVISVPPGIPLCCGVIRWRQRKSSQPWAPQLLRIWASLCSISGVTKYSQAVISVGVD